MKREKLIGHPSTKKINKEIRECLFCKYYRASAQCISSTCCVEEEISERKGKCTDCSYANESGTCFNSVCYKELLEEHRKRWAFRYPKKEKPG